MLRNILNVIARPMVSLWLGVAAPPWRSWPRPVDTPRAHTAGVDPVRLLLIGSGAAVGFGVLSYDLGLAGHLARKLSSLTGRATDVDVLADPEMTVTVCRNALEALDLGRYDAIVTMIGGRAAQRLEPTSKWRTELTDLLDYIDRTASSGVFTFVVGVPLIKVMADYPRVLLSLATGQAARLNKYSELACESYPRVFFVSALPQYRDASGYSSTTTYSDWADLLGPTISAVLTEHSIPTIARPSNELDRQLSLDKLGILDIDSVTRFEDLAELARNFFGTTGAAVTFVDHDRLVFKAVSGLDPSDVPRAAAFCDVTIRRAGLFVVPDTAADLRFEQNPAVIGPPHVRFYAGYPIEAPGGQRIGALCVLDRKPREFTSADASLLRDLAKIAESRLAIQQSRVDPLPIFPGA
jgi:GAF domain-containing protein